jgi:hypothetical protein
MDLLSGHPLTVAIADYLVAKADIPSIDAVKPRLAHVLAFMGRPSAWRSCATGSTAPS